MHRKNALLSIESDKTDEAELQRTVEHASAPIRPHGAAVVEYTSQAYTKSIPCHYVIYGEHLAKRPAAGTGAAVDKKTLDRCCLEMEEAYNLFDEMHCQGLDQSVSHVSMRSPRGGICI